MNAPGVRSLSLGEHYCEICPSGARIAGNGEVHVITPDGIIYCAPWLILHYIEDHGYVPPAEFVDGLLGDLPYSWNATSEHLCRVLLDDSLSPGWRVDAAIDLAGWQDDRVYGALLDASRDAELVDVSAMEIGVSLAVLWGRAGKVNFEIYKSALPQVQWGVYREVWSRNPDLAVDLSRPPEGFDF
ncbi:DUF7919 family protein [Actinacidiphila oryziradicis]|uniref:DUF7919 domain-containing protein n=1 Tax=Actinacidiphila oryziradicis TaxID=2571141 RepID=A0A4U0RB50_9ACTN|nr:hypothetical protein [Actinacidiphila oryziradicis]TJZ92429.1 hypothetical protein FCI23_55125 [Actinacidiphila oryziradicis]